MRKKAWLPFIDNDIQQFLKICTWLYDSARCNVMIIADARSGWLEAFLYTDRSTRNVIRCLRTTFTWFGIPFMVLFDNGKEVVSEDLKVCFAAQECRRSKRPLYSPKSNELADRTVQTLKRSLKLKLLLEKHLRNPVASFYEDREKTLYTSTSNHEPIEVTYIPGKERNTT